MKYTLMRIEANSNEVYHYKNEEGETIAFHSHPTREWTWAVLDEGTTIASSKTRGNVIIAFLEAGLNQHKIAGGFDEAIKVLEV